MQCEVAHRRTIRLATLRHDPVSNHHLKHAAAMIPLFPVVVALVVPTSEPIIRRADRPDSAYCHLAAHSKALVSIGRAGDGTLIGPKWVLTAGHVAQAFATRQPEKSSVEIGGATYRVAATFVHPDWTEMGPNDVGLLRLERAVSGVTPVSLYRGRNETGLTATLLGHGKAGTGANRDHVEDARARGATSRVDSADSQWLYFSFDAPPSGTDLEGAPGPGDSGGPALITVGGKTYIAGVSSAGYDGVDGPGTYGAIDVFTRVSTHLAWIDSVMKNVTYNAAGVASTQNPALSTVQNIQFAISILFPKMAG